MSPGQNTVVLVSEIMNETSKIARLNGLFNFTTAEAEVALMLAEGLALREIAERRQSSIYTVRFQVNSAKSKAGVRRQLDLVRVLKRHDLID